MSYKRASFDPSNNETITGLWDFNNDASFADGYSLISNGNFYQKSQAFSGPVTVDLHGISANLVYIDSTGGAINVLLPADSTFGRTITIKDMMGTSSVNNITITPDGLDTIDDDPTYVISGDYDSITLTSQAGGWRII